ncbi:ribosome biogenesis GTPase Der [Candidatus Izemoplasma sp. B36]|uniref:ribosome biogenesis GTPase Der n=1 Tax=Candidatus Izemoplasma sp. B36 TaxID=3242468 RepID=UPI0035587DD1
MLPVVAIVGRPNVGKSTLFNRIIGDRISITDDLAGITRDRIYGKASWLSRQFRLIDTGGIEINDAPFLTEIKAQADIAISEADVIIFAVDGKEGLLPSDRDVMEILYQADKPIIVAANKLESQKHRDNLYDFYELGASSVVLTSSAHGIGIGNLLDEVIKYLPEETKDDYKDDYRKISIIGRPNVGKSSLTNAILGNERVIVSNTSGTTTDSIDTEFVRDDINYVVIDTAGMKKRGKIYENIDKYANLRAMSAIERSDICLVVIDAETGIQAQDKHIAGYALENNKALILVVNKWDTLEKDEYTMNEWEKNIRKEFRFLSYIPIIYLSAKTKARMKTLFPVIEQVYENFDRRVSTSVLNEVIQEAMLLNPPKDFRQKRVRVYYATQVKTKCPTFVLFVNDTECMHFSYKRYLENRLRERFDFIGTPLNLVLRTRE